jgi:regulator of protease activity HflC (stomatin/prohibitin superfamily)
MKEHEERVDKRVEESVNRVIDVLKEFKVEADKNAERSRVEADKNAERSRVEAEKIAERSRIETEKIAERIEKSTGEKLNTLYWKLIVGVSGVVAVIAPTALAGFEFFGGRIVIPGNR